MFSGYLNTVKRYTLHWKLPVFLLRAVAILGAFAFTATAQDWTLSFSDDFKSATLDLSRWSPHDPLKRSQTPARLITTYGLFSQAYGRFEIRFRGADSSLRLLPIPAGDLPNIEIFRLKSRTEISFGNRWGSEQTERSYGDSFTVSDLSAGFHTVVLEWERDSLRWFLDGKEKFQSADGVPRQAMYLLFEGPGDIDYIHVYKRK